MYLIFSLRSPEGIPNYGLPTLSLVVTIFALFLGTVVSIQAFIMAFVINVIIIAVILRIASIINDTSIFSLLFQLSLVHLKLAVSDIDPYSYFLDFMWYHKRYVLATILRSTGNRFIPPYQRSFQRRSNHLWNNLNPRHPSNLSPPNLLPLRNPNRSPIPLPPPPTHPQSRNSLPPHYIPL